MWGRREAPIVLGAALACALAACGAAGQGAAANTPLPYDPATIEPSWVRPGLAALLNQKCSVVDHQTEVALLINTLQTRARLPQPIPGTPEADADTAAAKTMTPEQLCTAETKNFVAAEAATVRVYGQSGVRPPQGPAAGAPATPTIDVSGARQNYRAQVEALALDDKCKVLQPDERAVLEEYGRGLIGFIEAHDTAFTGSEQASLDAESEAEARATPCDSAAPVVRAAYENGLVIKLSVPPSILTAAMHLGEKCNVISKDDDHTLMLAWTQMLNDVARRYNASIRVKFVMRVNAAEGVADRVPCSDAQQTVTAALALARQTLHN